MRDWALSGDGTNWPVIFHVRNLGGHLDLSLSGGASTLAAWAQSVLRKIQAVRALPLHEKVSPGAVRAFVYSCGISGLGACWSAALRAVWSARMRVANPGASLVFIDGPRGADPAFHTSFHVLRRYLACRPDQVPGTLFFLDELCH